MERQGEATKFQNTLFGRVRKNISGIVHSIITEYHLKRIKKMTIREIINDPMSRMLFSEYLIIKNVNLGDEILLNWKCYELCKAIQKKPQLINRGHVFQHLIHNSPTNIWELELWTMIHKYNENKNRYEMYMKLEKLKNDCIMNMESHSKYCGFMSDLHFKTWRLMELISYVISNRRFVNYSPYFLNMEDEIFLLV